MTPPLPRGLPEVAASRPLVGGSICDVWWARLADDRQVVVKRTPYPAEVEADGLAALAAAGAPVPDVLGVDGSVLVMSYVTGPPDWANLGARLADLHRRTADAHAHAGFGWHRDNMIGSLPQRNGPHPHWPTFYAERRIRPLLGGRALPETLRRRLDRALDGPLLDLLDHDPAPSLVHGDLWSGNVVDGRWLIDPAVHRADRELELAFADLFGGLPAAFTDAYTRTWPLADGYTRRRPALQLYHLLVHVELFGGGYAGAVAARLDDLGW
jgi:fructosamine-3-kinase